MLKKIGLQEIARAAGVSASTVCRAMNTPGSVKQETLAKVNSALAELGYYNTGNEVIGPELRCRTILVFINDVVSPFYNDILTGIQETAIQGGYEMFVKVSTKFDSTLDEILRLCKSVNACGVIVLHSFRDKQMLTALDRIIPVVQCCSNELIPGISSVSIDDYVCGRKVTEFLLSRGRKRIALINTSSRYPYAVQRERGYRDMLYEAGVTLEERLVYHIVDINYESAYMATVNLLSAPEPPDAIFAVSDTVAAGVVNAARQLGVAIPEQLAVVGVDNTLFSRICYPPVTTVNQPRRSMGALCCEILMSELQNPGCAATQVTQEFELVIREST